MQYNAIQYNTIQYKDSLVQYNTIQYNTKHYNTIQYNTCKLQYNTIQYNTIQYNAIQYNTIDRLYLWSYCNIGAAQSLESTVTLVFGVAMYTWMLNEKCSCLITTAIILTVIGVFMVVQPDFTPNRYRTNLVNWPTCWTNLSRLMFDHYENTWPR